MSVMDFKHCGYFNNHFRDLILHRSASSWMKAGVGFVSFQPLTFLVDRSRE